MLFAAYCVWRSDATNGKKTLHEPENRKHENWLMGLVPLRRGKLRRRAAGRLLRRRWLEVG